MIELILDFETANPYLDLAEVGSTVYAQHWATEILCLNFFVYGSHQSWLPGPIDKLNCPLNDLALCHDALFIAHNVGFEKDIWREIMVPQFGFPDIPNERWHDTMAVAAYKSIHLGLDKVLPQLGLGAKDMVGSKLTIGLSKWIKPTKKNGLKEPALPERTPELRQRIYTYCGHDVADERKVHARLGLLPDSERRVWLLDQRINERGVRLDRDFLVAAARVVDLARAPLIAEFQDLTGGLNPGQVAKVVEWANAQGANLPNLQKGTIAEALGEQGDGDEDVREGDGGILGDLPGNVRRALAIRSLVGSSSISKLSRMVGCIGHDGRARRLLQYHGTGPGRWAGRLFNPLNFPRGIAKLPGGKSADPETVVDAVVRGGIDGVAGLGLVVEDPPNSGSWRPANPIEVIASSLRHAIIPADGHLLSEGDYTQIQARLVLAIAGQHDFLERLVAGHDPYCMTAEGIYGKPPGTWIKATCPSEIRQIGKNTFLGSGFQMGAPTFCQKYIKGCTCPLGTRPCQNPESAANQQAVQGITAYREKIAPTVPKVWRALADASLKAVVDRSVEQAYGFEYRMEDGWLSVRLLDGKKIWYWNPQVTEKQLPWDRSHTQRCWTYQTIKNGQMSTVYPHGGLLTENVVMGMERQLLVDAMLRCEAENFPVIFNGYDAIVAEPPERIASWDTLEQIMTEPPAWAKQIKLPVGAEGWIGTRYKKG